MIQLDPVEAYQFDLQGFLLLPGALAPELVERLRAELVKLEQTPKEDLPGHIPVSWTPVVNEFRLLNVLEADDVFLELIDHPSVMSRVDALIEAPLRLTEAYSITRGKGTGLPLHKIKTAGFRSTHEGPRCDHLTAMLALSDVGPEDGPLVVFEGTHKLGADFPYGILHPDWTQPEHDLEISEAWLAQDETLVRAPWEEIPGYREITVEAGDVILMMQSLWHGAKELRSERIRRTLYYSYSPYHFPNWHGIEWSERVMARVGGRRHEMLSGPFLGTRYPDVKVDVPAYETFPVLPDSGRDHVAETVTRGDAGEPDAEAP